MNTKASKNKRLRKATSLNSWQWPKDERQYGRYPNLIPEVKQRDLTGLRQEHTERDGNLTELGQKYIERDEDQKEDDEGRITRNGRRRRRTTHHALKVMNR